MTIQLGPLDYIIFFAALIGVMVIGFIAGRKDNSAEDYFLAGRSIRWFGVAGSIFGSNVSANHMVGMLGIGFSIGFAQSHFELGAIAGLLLMCYGSCRSIGSSRSTRSRSSWKEDSTTAADSCTR